MHYLLTLFSKEPYMFRTDLLSIIRSRNTLFTANDKYLLLWIQYQDSWWWTV